LTLKSINGTIVSPIVIMGNSAIFLGQACCNIVSITKCSYLIIKDLKLDGLSQNIDAIKAEETTDNWAHHITYKI